MIEWIGACIILAMPAAFVVELLRSLHAPVPDAPIQDAPRPWRYRPPTLERPDLYDDTDDGLITIAHLESHLPDELPFQGHSFKRQMIGRRWSDTKLTRPQYIVIYKCDQFFNCDPPVRPWYPKAKMAEQYGMLALPITESTHEDLGGMMFIDRVPPERLPEVLREQLKKMCERLEQHVEEEAALGCSIRPAPDRAA